MPKPPRALLVVAAASALCVAGCRQRQIPDAPAVPPLREAAAEVAMMAAPLPATELRGVPPSGLCSVDTVDGRYFEGGMLGVAGSNAVRIRGWFGEAGDDGAPRPVGPFRIVLADLAGAWAIPSRTGAPRPDAADYFEEPAMGTAGFAQLSDLSAMPPATYRVLLLSGSRDAPSACDSGKRLELR